jgi:iron complex transport system substrate-binding protein
MAACKLGFKHQPKQFSSSNSVPQAARLLLLFFFPVCLFFICSFLLCSLSACHSPATFHQNASRPIPSCAKLVSFSPSITEIVYALKLDRQLVGVTRFCKYPPQAQQKTSVGGYLDPNLETVIRLQPTLVLLRQEQTDIKGRLVNFQIPTLSVEHRTVSGILDSFQQVGSACDRQALATEEVHRLKQEIARIHHQTVHVKFHPRVLVVVDRDIRYNMVKHAFVAAHDGFFDWLLTEAGATNAVSGQTSGFSELSTEGILRLNPDVVIELMPSLAHSSLSQAEIQRAWQTMPSLAAVRNHRLILFTDDYMSIPGPRFVLTLRRFAETLHPELDWSRHG